MEIEGKVAVVTGAGAGIGEATALRLAAEGAAVVVADVDPAGAETARRIEAGGGRAIFVHADVADEEDVLAMVAAADRLGGVEILVNNAGVVEGLTTQLENFPAVEPHRWERMLRVNLCGVVLGTQAGIEAMRRRGHAGVIVNIASMAGIGHSPHPAPVYAASKAAVARFSAALAPLAGESIRVNCVCPDWVRTPMVERARVEMPPQLWRAIAPAEMLGAEDIADAVVQLVRDDSLAGRVMLCLHPGGPHPLLPNGTEEVC